MPAILGLLGVALFMFVYPLVGVLFGAFSGWVVGLIFGDWVLLGLAQVLNHPLDLTMVQLGAALGFVGGFFKSTLQQK